VDFLQPRTLREALEAKADRPESLVLAGGTDVMVDLNFDRKRPEAILDLTRVPDLRGHTRMNGEVRLGSGATYTHIYNELAVELPGLTMAARTIGSPQIRNRGTVGGNLGTASPAGDAIPPLLAAGASIEISSARGDRVLPVEEFLVGPKRNALQADELITAIVVPAARGPQQFSKIGARNAMVIAIATFAVSLDLANKKVTTGVGSAGPVVFRATEAEDFINDRLTGAGSWQSQASIPDETLKRFGALVANQATPIDDVRGSAAYRRHALGVLAGRSLKWAWASREVEG
jgi:CO/xanthine dehydrogenase FAD-binding subunit